MRLPPLLAAVLAAGTATAEPCPGQAVVVDCDISSTKRLTVCIGGGQASYAFGPAGAPELALTRPLGEMRGTAWAGVGRSIWEEIIFDVDEVSYMVWHSMDRLAEGNPVSGGVVVQRGDQTLANLECWPGTTAVSIFSISDGFAEAGFCWDRQAGRFELECEQ